MLERTPPGGDGAARHGAAAVRHGGGRSACGPGQVLGAFQQWDVGCHDAAVAVAPKKLHRPRDHNAAPDFLHRSERPWPSLFFFFLESPAPSLTSAPFAPRRYFHPNFITLSVFIVPSVCVPVVFYSLAQVESSRSTFREVFKSMLSIEIEAHSMHAACSS